MSDLVERARKFAKWGLYGGEPVDRSDFTAWADRIEELERAGRELMLAAEGTDMEYAVALKLQRLGEVLKRKP
jgi:hypothetical protein